MFVTCTFPHSCPIPHPSPINKNLDEIHMIHMEPFLENMGDFEPSPATPPAFPQENGRVWPWAWPSEGLQAVWEQGCFEVDGEGDRSKHVEHHAPKCSLQR